MITHPFLYFCPPKAKYLLLGSFCARPQVGYDWFYGTKVNQFWSIIESVYNIKLENKEAKQRLFTKLGIAISDVILECDRNAANNSDTSLVNPVFNTKIISNILKKNKISKIYFSSKFAENLFKRNFGELMDKYISLEFIVLPSPSPRNARLSKSEKITIYRKLLPKCNYYL